MEKKLLVVVVLTLILFLLARMARKRKAIRILLIACASVLALLLLLEFGYRVFIKKKDATDTVQPNSLSVPDSLLGYKHNEPSVYTVVNSFPGGDTVFNTSYTIIEDTFHSGIPFNFRKGYKSDSSYKEAVFLGCGLTFGQGLSDTQTLPCYYGAAANISTINMGCSSYGVHQVYQLFESKFGNLDNHNRIFVYSFFYDHILHANGIYKWNSAGPFFDLEYDSWQIRGPLYKYKQLKDDNWSVYASMFGTFSFIKDPLHKKAYREAGKNLSKLDYDRCIRMMLNIAVGIKNSGGRLIILNWGSNNKRDLPLNDMSESMINKGLAALEAYGAQVVAIDSIININDPVNFIPVDGHPSAVANQSIANWLAKHTTFSY